MVGYFGHRDYKLLEREMGWMFRLRDVIFEEEMAHRTLPDDRTGNVTNLYDVFAIDTTEGPITPQTTPDASNNSATSQLDPTDKACNQGHGSNAIKPWRSSRLAAKHNMALELQKENLIDDTDDPESEEEMYASMPSALSVTTNNTDNLWIPKSYSEAT
ncbi:hypothetical protein C0992_009717 [Termitomyces sp. T32_za158]|nr:hypothetical protein C0992_009717 [Termitomyces sp. T32_za158]